MSFLQRPAQGNQIHQALVAAAPEVFAAHGRQAAFALLFF